MKLKTDITKADPLRHLIFLCCLFPLLSQALTPGQMVPSFKVPHAESTYDLKELLKTNAALVVVFMATKCPYSNMYNDRFNQLVEDLKKLPKPVVFLGVNSSDNETVAEIKKHSEERKYLFTVVRDEKRVIAEKLGAEKTPEAFLISAEGRLVYRGRLDDDTEGRKISRRDLWIAIEELLSEKKISRPLTKAFGCSIKRR